MHKTTSKVLYTAMSVSLLAAMACGDDHAKIDGGHTPIDSPHADGQMIDSPGSGSAVKQFHQIEQLARPGINEALLISNDFLNGYNAAAPTFQGVDPTTLSAVVGEAKTVLKAVYFGVCLLDGTVTNDPAQGLKPAGLQCPAVGGAIFTENSLAGVHPTAAMLTAAQTYADAGFALFIPDVMRVDTGVAVSGYANELCGAGSGAPLLCGGRFVDDDVIDVTYGFLFNGVAGVQGGTAPAYNQVSALLGDGVEYYNSAGSNKYSAVPPDPTNPNQFHPVPSQAFPYSADPF